MPSTNLHTCRTLFSTANVTGRGRKGRRTENQAGSHRQRTQGIVTENNMSEGGNKQDDMRDEYQKPKWRRRGKMWER